MPYDDPTYLSPFPYGFEEVPQTLLVDSTDSHTKLEKTMPDVLERYTTEYRKVVTGKPPIIPPKPPEHTNPTYVFYVNTTTRFQVSKHTSFKGACLDIGAQKFVIGHPQAISYQ